jgi:hypothetical protein
MAAKPRRRPAKRSAASRQHRPRWVARIVLMGGLLFAVFVAAAGATFWFAESRRAEPDVTSIPPADSGEGFTRDERDALEKVLKEEDRRPNP